MANNKKSKNKRQEKINDQEAKTRTRNLQILFMVFSVILILSMVLSIASK